jgi:hypothetical protein
VQAVCRNVKYRTRLGRLGRDDAEDLRRNLAPPPQDQSQLRPQSLPTVAVHDAHPLEPRKETVGQVGNLPTAGKLATCPTGLFARQTERD